MRDNDRYYLTGTCYPFWAGENPGIKLWSSDDLLHWRFERLLIDRATLPAHAWFRDAFWAPEICLHNGSYYLTFNCRNEQTGFPQSAGMAVADSISGPYTVITTAEPLVERANDAHLFCGEGGDCHLFFATGGDMNIGGVFRRPIDLDTVAFTGPTQRCFGKGKSGSWDRAGVEGSFVVRRGDVYYHWYSSWTNGYAAGYCTAPSLEGPWRKSEENPILHDHDQIVAPGHNSIFTDVSGNDRIAFHFLDSEGLERLGIGTLFYEPSMSIG